MQQSAIFAPFLSMMLLSMTVWVYMYVRRIHYYTANNIDPQAHPTRAKAADLGPDSVQSPANNLQNLLELPVLFYALSLYLFVTAQVDDFFVYAAWLFFSFRALHSLIHCTINRVMWRFYAYLAGALVLWTMIVRAALAAF